MNRARWRILCNCICDPLKGPMQKWWGNMQILSQTHEIAQKCVMILLHFQFSLYGVVVFIGVFKGCIFQWQNLHIMLRNVFVMKSVGVILFFMLIWTSPFVGPLHSLTIGFLCIIFYNKKQVVTCFFLNHNY